MGYKGSLKLGGGMCLSTSFLFSVFPPITSLAVGEGA